MLGELDAYAPLVSRRYCVVFDTFVEDMPPKFFADRPGTWATTQDRRAPVAGCTCRVEIDTEMEQRLRR